MQVKTVAVIGSGIMGSGIAQVSAIAGFETKVFDSFPGAVDKAKVGITKSLDKAVEKGKLTPDQKAMAATKLHYVAKLEDAVRDADLVIEAIVEDEKVKKELFTHLDKLAPKHAVLASNTSSIPITVLARATSRPRQVVGMHFFNPVPIMKLLELINAAETSRETKELALSVGERMGKTVVEVNDYPGFVSNRVLMPLINEAVFALHEGVATREAIDTVMKLGMNHPMGPLELADFIGLDTCLHIMHVLHDGFKDPKYRPCPLLVKKVQAGHLGKKSGRGFYEYA